MNSNRNIYNGQLSLNTEATFISHLDTYEVVVFNDSQDKVCEGVSDLTHKQAVWPRLQQILWW